MVNKNAGVQSVVFKPDPNLLDKISIYLYHTSSFIVLSYSIRLVLEAVGLNEIIRGKDSFVGSNHACVFRKIMQWKKSQSLEALFLYVYWQTGQCCILAGLI